VHQFPDKIILIHRSKFPKVNIFRPDSAEINPFSGVKNVSGCFPLQLKRNIIKEKIIQFFIYCSLTAPEIINKGNIQVVRQYASIMIFSI
jgi:hypothetical protein